MCVAGLTSWLTIGGTACSTYQAHKSDDQKPRTDVLLLLRHQLADQIGELLAAERETSAEGLNADCGSDVHPPPRSRLSRAMRAYWHHLFDEWYIMNELDRQELRSLWISTYEAMVHRDLEKKRCLRVAFSCIHMEEAQDEAHAAFAHDIMTIVGGGTAHNLSVLQLPACRYGFAPSAAIEDYSCP